MKFNARWEQVSGVLISRLEGEWIGLASKAWRAEIQKRIDSGARWILLDFTKLEIISSDSLGALLSVAKETRWKGGEVKLLNLPPIIAQIFAITRLLRAFEIFNDEQVALRSFGLP